MRKKRTQAQSEFSILALDDDEVMTLTLKSYFEGSGYQVDTETDPNVAISRIREGHYDILLLDFLMTPICGDQVVEQIRVFNQEIFIILLTGHKSMAPPIKTIRALDIQGYYEKSDRFDQLELLVESCVKSIRQLRTIHNYQDGLSAMVDGLPRLYQLQDREELAASALRVITELSGARGGLLALEWEKNGFQLFHIGETIGGFSEENISDKLAALHDQTAIDDKRLSAAIYGPQHQEQGLLAVELTAAPAQYQVQLFQLYTRQLSAAFSNLLLHERLKSNYLEMIQGIRLMVDAKDDYTRGHSDRVSFYAYHTAVKLGRDRDFCERVRVAGLFHDIGKLGVPDEILLKETSLTPEERSKIQEHSENGWRILSAISLFRDIAPIVRAHHERPDGHGYPDGIPLCQIPEEARIIALADAYDAMASHRRYRASLGHEKAMEEIRMGAGYQFDPALVDTFLKVVSEYPATEEENP